MELFFFFFHDAAEMPHYQHKNSIIFPAKRDYHIDERIRLLHCPFNEIAKHAFACAAPIPHQSIHSRAFNFPGDFCQQTNSDRLIRAGRSAINIGQARRPEYGLGSSNCQVALQKHIQSSGGGGGLHPYCWAKLLPPTLSPSQILVQIHGYHVYPGHWFLPGRATTLISQSSELCSPLTIHTRLVGVLWSSSAAQSNRSIPWETKINSWSVVAAKSSSTLSAGQCTRPFTHHPHCSLYVGWVETGECPTAVLRDTLHGRIDGEMGKRTIGVGPN